jgi:hypothetical protein
MILCTELKVIERWKNKIDDFTLYLSGSKIFNSLRVNLLTACNCWDIICWVVEAGNFLTMFVESLNLGDDVSHKKQDV